MSMTDPISDLLTRIRNGLRAKKRWVNIPSSNEKMRILYILKEEKYIEDFMLIDEKVKKQIRIFLKYDYRGSPVISGIERISKPGLRIYKNRKDLPRVLDGLGIAILSTSKGIISNKTAKKIGVGGEVICNVW